MKTNRQDYNIVCVCIPVLEEVHQYSARYLSANSVASFSLSSYTLSLYMKKDACGNDGTLQLAS